MAVDPELCIEVPADFDDSDSDSQVHPIARKMFFGRTNAEVFSRAQLWANEQHVHLLDAAWDEMYPGAVDEMSGEAEPYVLTVYFSFEFEDEDEPALKTPRAM